MVNYWTVLLLFTIVESILGFGSSMPGSFSLFIKSFFALTNSYNGAWWYVFTYILLVVTFPLFNKIIDRLNVYVVCISALIISMGAMFAFKFNISSRLGINNEVLKWFMTQLINFCKYFFPYIIGIVFYKYKTLTFLKSKLSRINSGIYNAALILIFISVTVFTTAFIHKYIIFPITSLIYSVLFLLMDKPKFISVPLKFIGKHSTNIWLIHLFFLESTYGAVVFKLKYPILIFLATLLLTIAASYIIKLIDIPFNKLIDKKKKSTTPLA